MKSLERLLLGVFKAEVAQSLDHLQFASSKKRSTSDAICSLMHFALEHLESRSAYARLLFIDFSSAFSSIQPHIFLKKLMELDFNPFLIKWYHSFLSHRSQQVKFNSVFSNLSISSTGAPQGCVSSPLLFILYTNDCQLSKNLFLTRDLWVTAVLSRYTAMSSNKSPQCSTWVCAQTVTSPGTHM